MRKQSVDTKQFGDRLSRREILAAAGAGIGAALLPGCGGATGITGGSVPLGRSRLQGQIVRADNILAGIAEVPYTLTLGASFVNGKSTYEGGFDFNNVAGGSYVFAIRPDRGTDLTPNGWVWRFTVPEGEASTLIAAVWPKWFDPLKVTNMELAPSSIRLKVGQSVRFVTNVYNENSVIVPIYPSMLLTGDIGTLEPEGTFRAAKPGNGTVTVWLPNNERTAAIEVAP